MPLSKTASIACALALAPWAVGSDQLVAETIAADDECAGGVEGESCAWSAVQLRGQRTAAAADCHDVQPGEVGVCMNSIAWARDEGYPKHPDWYQGLSPATAKLSEWQMFAWDTTHPTCPRPCSAKWDVAWCDSPEAPELWKAKLPETPSTVRILSYNLFWWNLFKIRGGLSADDLIKKTGAPEPYDVIGLQECEDPDRVFKAVGLDSTYSSFLGSKAVCVAYRTDRWELLDSGEDEVAMDMRTEFYGHRVAQWLRLQDRNTGMTMLFINHHGPLSVNSGGACGGRSTAHNLLKVMAKRGREGDLLVLAGDFNANAASQTVQSLWPHLLHVYNSPSFGGVDNIFANVPREAVSETNDLGKGGSDHHAISAVLSFPVAMSKSLPGASAVPDSSVEALQKARGTDGCLFEPKQMFVYSESDWGVFKTNIVDPRMCCNVCQVTAGCTAFAWEEWNEGAKGPLCSLRQGEPMRVDHKTNAVSGLPHAAAVKQAVSKSATR